MILAISVVMVQPTAFAHNADDVRVVDMGSVTLESHWLCHLAVDLLFRLSANNKEVRFSTEGCKIKRRKVQLQNIKMHIQPSDKDDDNVGMRKFHLGGFSYNTSDGPFYDMSKCKEMREFLFRSLSNDKARFYLHNKSKSCRGSTYSTIYMLVNIN